MKTIGLQNVDLSSIQRAAPRTGAPSSSDYNASMREILSDLNSLSDQINQDILPLLNALPVQAKDGLAGTTIFANPNDTGSLFYNRTANTPYTVSEVCQNIYSLTNGMNQKIADLGSRVAKLQTLLSTTGQSDILASVQNFSDQIKNITSVINTLRTTMGSYESRFQMIRSVRLDVPDADPSSVQTLDVNFDVAFKDNNYTVSLSVEDVTGGLELAGWVKQDNGRGVRVAVHNASSSLVVGGILHLIGQYNGSAA